MPLWNADVHIDERLTRRLLESQFPALAPARLTLLGQGFDNAAWRVNDRWVVRMPRRKIADEIFAYERAVLPLIGQSLPLRVPFPELIGTATADYPYVFSGYRMLPGLTGCSEHITPHQRAQAAVPLATFLRALHDLPITGDLERAAPPDLIGRTDLVARTQRIFAAIDGLVAAGASGPWPALRSQLSDLSTTPPWQGPPTLVHGDLYDRHLIFEGGVLTGVIDWGDVHVSDPALDLGIAWSFLSAGARAHFMAAYGEVDRHTQDRALYKALSYGVFLTAYGLDVGDEALLRVAQRCLSLTRGS